MNKKKVMYKLIIFCIVVISLASCGNSQNRNAKQSVETVDKTTVTDSHNARNSLSYYGVYEGVFPCADCEGIKTRVILYMDGTYMIDRYYIKNGESLNPDSLKGKFMWNDKGQVITLEGARAKNFPAYFFVAEGRLIAVDENDKDIDSALSEHYILKQTEVFQ